MLIKPTAEQLRNAVNGRTPDILQKNLRVVFCGINPSVYSVVVGHHFARPGNRFWKALHGGGFTPHLLAPHQDRELLKYGCGITNVVDRATVSAAELSGDEFVAGGKNLQTKMKKYKPQWLAVLGISAYRIAFAEPKAVLGLQESTIGGARVWVLPNPSGLNAHYHPPELARLFAELREAIEANALAR